VTSPEYRTLREACGLTVREAAAFHQVAERTIVHWETGRNAIPAGAAEELARLNAKIDRAVQEAIDLYAEQSEKHGDIDTVALSRYRTAQDYAASRAAREGLPHSCHNALVARTMTALRRIGAPVKITWG
jgi:DNA-binding XRE family transcriptional regulator